MVNFICGHNFFKKAFYILLLFNILLSFLQSTKKRHLSFFVFSIRRVVSEQNVLKYSKATNLFANAIRMNELPKNADIINLD